jgi:hypothetical protein
MSALAPAPGPKGGRAKEPSGLPVDLLSGGDRVARHPRGPVARQRRSDLLIQLLEHLRIQLLEHLRQLRW